MVISFKMIDGSRIDVPITKEQQETIIDEIECGYRNWFGFNDGNRELYLHINNIVSVIIKGDGDDS